MTVTENSFEPTLPSGLFICNCEVKRQLNGTTFYAVFEGKEADIINAFNSLYNANAYNGELEFLTDTLAFVVTTEKQFKKGLFNRQSIRLLVDNDSKAFKGFKGGINALAQSKATTDYSNMRDIRAVMPVEALIAEPYAQREMPASVEWHNEKPDANEE